MMEGRMDTGQLFASDCPRGYVYYHCQSPKFDGCCSTDPCKEGGCDDSFVTATNEPDPDPTTSPTEIASVGPPETAAPTDTTTSSAAVSSPDATSSGSISGTASPTATTITVPPPHQTGHPTSVPEGNDAGGGFTLGTAGIAGISVGGVVGGLLLIFVVFLLIRRRKLAKRMPSFVDARGDQLDEKLMRDNQSAPMGVRTESNGEDVFAPFGGRAASPVKHTEQGSAEPSKRFGTPHDSMRSMGGNSSLVSPLTPTNTGPSTWKDFPGGRAQDTIEEETSDVPAQLDSSPVYIELDSRDTERPAPAELPSALGPPSIPRPKSTNDVLNHPRLLIPGFSRTMTGTIMQSDAAQHGRARSDSGNPLRGTLNATSAEWESNRHVNSWTHL
ncbi:amidase [Apiospora rasikravindrae]|uniref:Amidase n=1 Tax=Apiospora rasikravindrae TaxID=990691 RepID=A0ABR1UCS2_9PEZI